MTLHQHNIRRKKLNALMAKEDSFFKTFGEFGEAVYSAGAIPKKYKELTGLAISILSRCDECVAYHLQGCLKCHATKKEIIEAIKIGVIGGGSITYPNARYAFSLLQQLKIK